MKSVLVSLHVAAADLGKNATRIRALVDGGSVTERGLEWVFNLANDATGPRRCLRFWRPELLARAQACPELYAHYDLTAVIANILPISRNYFHGGELDDLFQVSPRARLDLTDLPGQRETNGHTYTRPALADFLARRWLGAAITLPKGRTP